MSPAMFPQCPRIRCQRGISLASPGSPSMPPAPECCPDNLLVKANRCRRSEVPDECGGAVAWGVYALVFWLLVAFGCSAARAEGCADLNRDGFVNFSDLSEFRQQFGKPAGEQCWRVGTFRFSCLDIAGDPQGNVHFRIERAGDCWVLVAVDEAGNENSSGPVCVKELKE